MTRTPVLPDAPPLMADANARFRRPRLTPRRVFCFTFAAASLTLRTVPLPGLRAAGAAVAQARESSAAHGRLQARLQEQAAWRPKLDSRRLSRLRRRRRPPDAP